MRIAKASRLLGAELILTGIGRQITETLARLGVEWGDVATEADLQTGIERANDMLRTKALRGPRRMFRVA